MSSSDLFEACSMPSVDDVKRILLEETRHQFDQTTRKRRDDLDLYDDIDENNRTVGASSPPLSAWWVQLRSPSGESVLQRAVFYGRVEIAKYLLTLLSATDGIRILKYYHRQLQYIRLHGELNISKVTTTDTDQSGADSASNSDDEDEADAERLRDLEFEITDYCQVPFYNDISEHPVLLALVTEKEEILNRIERRQLKRTERTESDSRLHNEKETWKHQERCKARVAFEALHRPPPQSLKRCALMHHSENMTLCDTTSNCASAHRRRSRLLRGISFEPIIQCLRDNAKYYVYSVEKDAAVCVEGNMRAIDARTGERNRDYDELIRQLVDSRLVTEKLVEEDTDSERGGGIRVSIQRLVFAPLHLHADEEGSLGRLVGLFDRYLVQSCVEFE